ncbi:MAG: lipid II flippase MurJ [Candidatus Zixiibacteriota bacterium]
MNGSSLQRAGAAVLLVSALVKAVGYAREAVVAAVFGTTAAIDLYLAAVALPAAICTVVYYSLPNAFVPLFAGDRTTTQRARRAAWGVAGLMLALSTAMWLLARPITDTLASGFSPEARTESAGLLRIGAWAVVLASAEALGRAHLLARRCFVRPGLAFVWQSVAVIVAAIVWPGLGARSLMWGYVVGSGLAAAWNFVLIPHEEPRGTTSPLPDDSGMVRPIGRWVATVLIIDAFAQFFSLIDRHLGSYLPAGSIAALQYGGQIAFIPSSILGMGLSTAIFPFLSRAVAEGDRVQIDTIIDRAVRWMILGAVPLVVWMVAFRAEVVILLFERGAFDAHSRQMTSVVLTALAVGLLPTVLTMLLSRVFYSSRCWRPLFYGSLIGVMVKAACGWWWVARYGVAGLAASTSVAYGAWLIPILWSLREHVPTGRLVAWSFYAARVLFLTAIPAVITVWLAGVFLPERMSPTLLAVVKLGAASVLGAMTILILGPHWGIAESATVRSWLAGLFRHARGGR